MTAVSIFSPKIVKKLDRRQLISPEIPFRNPALRHHSSKNNLLKFRLHATALCLLYVTHRRKLRPASLTDPLAKLRTSFIVFINQII
jgi:hypothetical protein